MALLIWNLAIIEWGQTHAMAGSPGRVPSCLPAGLLMEFIMPPVVTMGTAVVAVVPTAVVATAGGGPWCPSTSK